MEPSVVGREASFHLYQVDPRRCFTTKSKVYQNFTGGPGRPKIQSKYYKKNILIIDLNWRSGSENKMFSFSFFLSKNKCYYLPSLPGGLKIGSIGLKIRN